MDESGYSPREPLLVVAGVMVHADTQLGAIEDSLQEIVDAHVPERLRDGFVLHASALFRADEKELPPELWDARLTWEILDRIVLLPAKLDLRISIALIDKRRFIQHNAPKGAGAQELRIAMHAAAIALCTVGCEQYLRRRAKDQSAFLFAEDNSEVRKAAKQTQILMKSKNPAKKLDLVTMERELLPLVRIKDGINFVSKQESKALQLADACAWAARKMFNREPEASRFYSALEPKIDSIHGTVVDAAARL
jgi:hypothetical protein